MTISRPMLAETIVDVATLKFPLRASVKLDGIRCLIVHGKAMTRRFKPIPNRFVREYLEANAPDGLDGELMLEDKTFNEIQSAIMSESGEPDFEYRVFDYVCKNLSVPFEERYFSLFDLVLPERIKPVIHLPFTNLSDLLKYEERALQYGCEGIMTRDPKGFYKCGRSTLKQGWLLKLKRFADSEARIISFEELMHNKNEAEINELGLTKRSNAKAGMIPANMLGQFQVQDIHTGQQFWIGTGVGLTQELRRDIWENKANYADKIIKYKYQPAGQKDLPRFPVYIGWRDERDM